MSTDNTVYDANYFLNKFNAEPSETEEEKKKREEEERLKQEQQIAELIRDEDVELLNYEGKKEKFEAPELEEKIIPDSIISEKPQYDSNYFLNKFNETPVIEDKVDDEEPTTAQKIELGASLERHTLGNLFRTVKAGVATLSNNKTFQDNIKQIEEERRTKIFNTLEEKYGTSFREHENDAATITGRVGVAIADPVTFFIPWAKVAKLGKLTATGVGAGIGAADMALYEYSAYGEVNPNNVLFGAAVGGGSSLLGSVVANRYRSVDGDEINLGKIDNPEVDTVVKSSVKDEEVITLTSKEINDLDNGIQKLVKENPVILKELEASPILVNMYRKAKNDILNYDNAKSLESKFNPSTGQLDFPDIARLDVKNKVRLSPTKLKNLKKKSDEAKRFLADDYFDLMKKTALGQVEVVDGQLKILSKDFELTDSLLKTVLNESFRPLFGGGVGFTAGTFIGDEDDTINYTLIGAGMTFGLMYNRVKDADYLLKGQKEKAFGIIENESARMLHNFLKVKGSGTTANRLVNHGDELEVIGRNLFTVLDGKHRGILSAEESSDLMKDLFSRIVSEVVQDASEAQRIAAGKIATKTATRAEIKALGFTTKEMKDIDTLASNSKLFVRENLKYVQDAGVTVKQIDNYDLPQMYVQSKVLGSAVESRKIIENALIAEFPKWDKITIKTLQEHYPEINKTANVKDVAKIIVENISGRGTSSMFKDDNIGSGILGKFVGIPELKNFQKERIFKSLEARKILEPILEKDIKIILNTLVKNTTKGTEFARKIGENGELLNITYARIRGKYERGLINEREYKDKVKTLSKTINAYFGTLHKSAADPFQSNLGKDGFALLTFLSNTTMLPRSIIPQLGDFLQPFQNSSVYSAFRGFAEASKKDSLASKYRIGGEGVFGIGKGDIASTVNKDIDAALSSGLHPSTKFQEKLSEWTQTFFKFNLMAPATNFAAKGAFSTGIDETFNIAKKIGTNKTISPALKNKLNYYGVSMKEIQTLNKFKNVQDAIKSEAGERILVKAGNRAKIRDVGLPGVGNRQFFAQSNNPAVKSAGLFLSWAQYKVAQMNSLIKRVEDGDLKLAIKMLGTIGIFAGLREAQIAASPAREYYEKNEPENFSAKWWGEGAALSGLIDWRAEKISRIFGTWAGSGYGTATSAISPLFGLIDRWYNNIGKTYRNLEAGDYEGATVSGLRTLPLGGELVDYTNRASQILTEEKLLEDKANRKSTKGYDPVRGYATGGLVKGKDDVPYTKENPANRVDPFTGQPYSSQMEELGLNVFQEK
jgi:hypothetical protein